MQITTCIIYNTSANMEFAIKGAKNEPDDNFRKGNNTDKPHQCLQDRVFHKQWSYMVYA